MSGVAWGGGAGPAGASIPARASGAGVVVNTTWSAATARPIAPMTTIESDRSDAMTRKNPMMKYGEYGQRKMKRMFIAMPIAGRTPPATASPPITQTGRLSSRSTMNGTPLSVTRKTGMNVRSSRKICGKTTFASVNPRSQPRSAYRSARWTKAESTVIRV